MFFDLHVHTGGISHCCRADAQTILNTAKEFGYEGVVITNHYAANYYLPENYDEWLESYVAEYKRCREYGESLGLKVLFGAEITMCYDSRVHLLIYGVTEEFIRKNKNLCEMTQQELYELCHKNGCALVNAHPFRSNCTVQDVKYLDGIELNCHPNHGDIQLKELEEIALNNALALTCGCDYHADSYRPQGGTFVPNEYATNEGIVRFIKENKKFVLKIHQPFKDAIIKEYKIQRG